VKFGADLLNQAQHALACAKEETSVGCDDVRSAKLRNVLARTQPDELSVPYSLSQRTSGSIAVVSVCFPDRTPYAQNRNREDTTESWAQICKAAKENFQAYCSRHGYRLFFMDHKPAKAEGRPATYAKVLAIQHALRAPDVEAAFYMDADSLFMNFEKDLDSLLPSGDKQVTISGDRNCWLNAGHMMFKSSKWTAKFLKERLGAFGPRRNPGPTRAPSSISSQARRGAGKTCSCARKTCRQRSESSAATFRRCAAPALSSRKRTAGNRKR
ncbi:unnamed protein product, partial [Effrenium voratum]